MWSDLLVIRRREMNTVRQGDTVNGRELDNPHSTSVDARRANVL